MQIFNKPKSMCVGQWRNEMEPVHIAICMHSYTYMGGNCQVNKRLKFEFTYNKY